jgi:hypothetical protein
LDKSHFGMICKSPRATREAQHTALSAAGAQWIVEIGKVPRSWREAVEAVREGDTVYIYALSFIPTKRGEDDLPPSAQVADFLIEVHERGGYVVEVYSGRKSNDRGQRREMAKDALKTIRRGSRALPSIGRGRGRPKKAWTPEQVAKAKEVWFSRDYTTNLAAERHLPKGMKAKHAWLLFGASGRPYKAKKR